MRGCSAQREAATTAMVKLERESDHCSSSTLLTTLFMLSKVIIMARTYQIVAFSHGEQIFNLLSSNPIIHLYLIMVQWYPF